MINEKSITSDNFVYQDYNINGYIDNEYIENVNYSPVFNLGSFLVKWIIPSSPPNPSGGTVQDDIWNGIQPLVIGQGGYQSIVQPVTSWSHSGHWSSYVTYVNSYNRYFYTPHIPSNVGDTIQGQLIWDQNNHWWYIRAWDLTNGNSQSNVSVLSS